MATDSNHRPYGDPLLRDLRAANDRAARLNHALFGAQKEVGRLRETADRLRRKVAAAQADVDSLRERAEKAETRLAALRNSRLAMTDGNELYWLDGEPGTPAGMTYTTAEIEALADAIIAQQAAGEEQEQ